MTPPRIACACFTLLVAAAPVPAQGAPTARDIKNVQRQAVQLLRAHRYAEAVPLREQAYRWCSQVYGSRHPETAAAAFELAEIYATVGSLGEVEPLLQSAVAVYRAQRNQLAVASVSNSLGKYYSRVGQIAAAERCWGECIRIFQATRREGGLSVVRYNLATMYRNVGLSVRNHARRSTDAATTARLEAEAQSWFHKAEQFLQTELAYVSRLRLAPNDPRRHNREMILGEVYLDLGRFQEADRLFVGTKAFSDRIGGRDSHGRDLLNLGLSRCALRRFDDALALFRTASAAVEKGLGTRSDVVPTTHALQARALGHLGRWEEAAAAMDRCQRLERDYALRVFPSLAPTEQLSYLFRPGYLEGTNFDLALALGATAPALAARSAEWIVNGKAVVHELLADSGARDDPRAQELRAVRARLAALTTSFFDAKKGSPEHDEATRQLSRLIQREADLCKQRGRARGRAERPAWIDLADVRRAIPTDAVLVECARFLAPTFGGAGAAAIAGEPRYAAWIVPPAGKGDVAVVDLGPAAPIETAVRRLRAAMDRDVNAIRKSVVAEANAALAAFARAHNLKPTDAAYQNKLRELSAAVPAATTKALTDKKEALLAAYRKDAGACAALLLHPLVPHLEGAAHVLLSPDAHVWLAPWDALPLPDGPLLVERAAVTYVVSGRDLLTPRAAVTPTAPVLLGDVDYDAGVRTPAERVAHPATALKWSATEMRGIRPHLKAYAGADAIVLAKGDASEDRLKAARNPKVLFLSTHGVFGRVEEAAFEPGRHGLLFENPLLRCQLSLAGCNRRMARGATDEDGRLYGIEVGALDLRGTDLVVLSACQTAVGDVNAGQGAAGLRQAFQLAGAKSVVATLWSVDDAATTKLTIACFENLAMGVPRSEALRRAKLAIQSADDTAHPFFWAAFTITENGAPDG